MEAIHTIVKHRLQMSKAENHGGLAVEASTDLIDVLTARMAAGRAFNSQNRIPRGAIASSSGSPSRRRLKSPHEASRTQRRVWQYLL